AVAQRSRDRYAKSRVGCRNPQVATGGDRTSAAGSDAFDLRDGRLRQTLEPVERAIQSLLVGDSIVAASKALELRDVGAGDEGVAAGAAQDEHADRVGRVDVVAGSDERVVHLPGHRVACFGPVKR